MIYEIQNKKNTVRIANSMQGVARYFKENKVRGFSARTLKKTLKQGVEQMSKQGYTITRVHKRNKIKADIKFRKASYNTFTNSNPIKITETVGEPVTMLENNRFADTPKSEIHSIHNPTKGK